MPRKLRLEYEGAIYHVMNRGDRKEDIFVDDPDRQRKGEAVERGCEKGANGGAFSRGNDNDVALDCGAAGEGALANGGQRRAASGVGPTEMIQEILHKSSLTI